jgi:hypothetical protein
MDGMKSEEEYTAKDYANNAYDAMRELGREIPDNCPAPMAYSIIGNVKSAGGYFLSHVLEKMAGGLTLSLTDFDVYDSKREPAESVAAANRHLNRAAELARQIAAELESAQTAINSQGYREPGDRGYREPEDRK